MNQVMYLFSIAYKKKIGFGGQLLIEPKPKEPTRHQYDYGKTKTSQIKKKIRKIRFANSNMVY